MNHLFARPVPDAISCAYLGHLTAKGKVDIEGFFRISRVLKTNEFSWLGRFAIFEDCWTAASDNSAYLHDTLALLCKGIIPAGLLAD